MIRAWRRAARQADAGLIVESYARDAGDLGQAATAQDPLATHRRGIQTHRCIGAVTPGSNARRIVIDPGLGFGKRKEQNAEILARLDELARLELPMMVGPSRKHFLARETALETEFAAQQRSTAAILVGVHMVRVHDVPEMHAVALIADEISKSAALLTSAS